MYLQKNLLGIDIDFFFDFTLVNLSAIALSTLALYYNKIIDID
jgi:hypothetical protein